MLHLIPDKYQPNFYRNNVAYYPDGPFLVYNRGTHIEVPVRDSATTLLPVTPNNDETEGLQGVRTIRNFCCHVVESFDVHRLPSNSQLALNIPTNFTVGVVRAGQEKVLPRDLFADHRSQLNFLGHAILTYNQGDGTAAYSVHDSTEFDICIPGDITLNAGDELVCLVFNTIPPFAGVSEQTFSLDVSISYGIKT